MSAGLLQFHERASVIAVAQKPVGKLLVWAAACALLSWHHVDPPMLAAFTLVLLFPQYRRPLLGLAALGLIALYFLPRDIISLGNLAGSLQAVSVSRWIEAGASIAVAVAAVLLLVWMAIRFDRLPAAVRAHPILLLHLAFGAALVAGAFWKVEVLLLAPFLLWRASYLLKSAAAGRAAGTKLTDHLFYLIPVFGGSNTPFGKGMEYLNRVEARTPEATARSQLAGIRLLALAAVLVLLLDLMLAVVHGRTDTLYRGRFEAWSLGLPLLAEILAGRENPGIALGWLAVYLELIRTTTKLAIFGHIVIGALRLLGFNVFRNTYKPLYATSIVEFWNRFFYYFKELLVEMFFYPAFYRSGWASPRLRTLIAVFAAAFAGNAYFHFLRDSDLVFSGDVAAIVTYWVPRLTYCFLLAFGIWFSMLRQQELRRHAGQARGILSRLRAIAGVWTFFGLLHTWLVEPSVAGAGRRADFFLSLVGL